MFNFWQFHLITNQIAKKYESKLYDNLPDLEEIMNMITKFDQPEVVVEKGIFEVFRIMSLEDDLDENAFDVELPSIDSSELSDQDNPVKKGQRIKKAIDKMKF